MAPIVASAIAALQGVWSFFKSPLGRYVAIGLAVVGLGLAVRHGGYSAGVKHEREAQAQRLAKAVKVVAKRETSAAKISTDAGVGLAKTRVEIQWRTKTLTERIPVYVTAEADARCILPVGFVRLHDAAAGGTPGLPAAAGGPVDTPSGFALSDLSATVLANYGVAHDWRAEALTWRSWYVAQAAAWAKP